MPTLEPKAIQKELSQDLFWPVYWLHGSESLKVREVVRRVRKALFPDETAPLGKRLGEEILDGGETSSHAVLDSAQSMALGGGARFVLVRDAHLLKEPEVLLPLLGPKVPRSEVTGVCIFISKDLDKRRKFSKQLMENAACVPCDQVPEGDREAWIGYLAKGREMALSQETAARLLSIDPWSLDIVDRELEKLALAQGVVSHPEDLVAGQGGIRMGSDRFLDAFFTRRLKDTLEAVKELSDRPEESIPLLGLLGWNVRHLAVHLKDTKEGTRSMKLSPYVQDRFKRWSSHWKMAEVVHLQAALSRLDYDVKQTPRLPLGMWASLTSRFCK